MISPPSAIAEAMNNPETDTSPVETMTVFRSAQTGLNISGRLGSMNADPVISMQSSGESNVNDYCANKLLSLSQGELQTTTEVSEESIAQILVCRVLVVELR